MFGAGKTVYHVENVIRETGEIVKDGLMSVYVNTEVKEDTLIGEFMQCFLKTDFEDDKFPNASRRMRELKHGEEDDIMCKSVEEYAEKKAREAVKEAEEKAKEAEKKAKEAEEKAKETEKKAKEAEEKAKETEEKAKETEEKAKEEKKSTVNNLYAMGMDTVLIAKAVNMDEETVKQWLSK